MDAKFSQIADYFKKCDYQNLSLEEKLMFIETLSRTAQGNLALEKIEQILTHYPSTCEILTTAGIVYFSLGRLDQTKRYIDSALKVNKDFETALITKVMLLLYGQQYFEAENLFEKIIKKNPGLEESYLHFIIGIDLYKAAGNPQKLMNLYSKHAQKYKKRNKSYSRNIKSSARLFKRSAKKKLFEVVTKSEMAAVPFSGRTKNNRDNVLDLVVENKRYKVLLDTGNAVGWMIHNRELKKQLKVKSGGRRLTRIGTQAGILDGYYIYSESVRFDNFKINHLIGLYVPKPHPDFYDANLNPIVIRNRVVTIDYEKKQVILRTKDAFDRYMDSLDSLQKGNLSKLPWYGYKDVLVPVIVNGKSEGLAVIETGAEEIALRLDFARHLGLELEPGIKYLANGKVFRYFKTCVKISAGSFLFDKKGAEVWPLDRFYNRLTGLAPDVIIGPVTLRKEKFILSFDPYEKQVILQKKKK